MPEPRIAWVSGQMSFALPEFGEAVQGKEHPLALISGTITKLPRGEIDGVMGLFLSWQ